EGLSRAANQRLQQLADQGQALAPGRGYSMASLPPALVQQVSREGSADVLVIMGAQHSAQRRYGPALYCLDRALQLQPDHVRGHYARGQ
ncbi:TPR_REGION domain-containing protein, partial [Haematococcus lacustris]